MLTSEELIEALRRMDELIPNAASELQFDDPFHLLIAVILSAQTTDKAVNALAPALFERFPTAEAMAAVEPAEIEPYIQSIGLFRNKAKFLSGTARKIAYDFHGEVPHTRKELESLPGVGRKTASVVLSVAFDQPAIAVDTHVERVAKRLKIVPENATPRQVENILMEKLPEKMWSHAHQLLVLFGRYYCTAHSEACASFIDYEDVVAQYE
ncbi:endonuclease III [Suicoccus acidiformans]|uniref:Endonuclease III n=1 Tax=Suicoccus acidiformans TaxID=2036206 RepID=A0A347WL81_9LACT|nr:endonuclease III [Suicoccus acidiformans]AXY25838.1 endonuclease III [Suicoccus acidiformans]